MRIITRILGEKLENKRKSPRINLVTCVDFEDNVPGQALDISEGGIQVVTRKPISIGTIISIVIPLCSGKIEKGIIKVLAVVKWNQIQPDGNYSLGLEFFYINDFEKEKLCSFISEKLVNH
jgi:c-di-GMP-binding flagellar brake protein YcgR